MASVAPVYTITDDTHSFHFPDGTQLELIRPRRDAVGRLWAEVVARAGAATLLNRGRLDLLNLQDRGRFAAVCTSFNGQIDWEARALFATEQVLQTLAPQPPSGTTPEPLRRTVAPPDPYPVEALGTTLAGMARALMAVVQAPDAICGQSVLAAAALAVQAHADVVIDGRLFPVSLFAIDVGESGERRSAVDGWALKPHREYEKGLHDAYAPQELAYQNAFEAYRKTREEDVKKAKGRAAKQQALEALGPPPLPPLEPILTSEEPTYEGLVKLLFVGQPSMGLFSDEGGRFLGGHGMNQDNALKTAAGLSELWDGKRITRVRSGEGTIALYGRRLSMHLMIQPVIATMLLSNTLLLGQGLLSRCLVAWPTSTAGSRRYQATDLTTEPAVRAYQTRLMTLLQTTLPLAAGRPNELSPRPLRLAGAAKALWTRFYDHVEGELGDGAPLAPIRGFANKAAEHAARLAGVLSLFDNLLASAIDKNHMEAGIELCQFYLTEALRLFDAASADPDIVLAEKLLAWLHSTNLPQASGHKVVSLQHIYQEGPSRLRDAKTARRIATILADHRWLMAVEGGMDIAGTWRREVWEVV